MVEDESVSSEKEDNVDEECRDLAASVKELFFTSKYSDLIIKSQDQEFKVHKAIIGGQSEYFDKLFNGDWKENNEATIELLDDDPGAIEAMIHHMYGADFEAYGIHHNHISLLFFLKVYQVADYYRVPNLKQNIREEIRGIASLCWDTSEFPAAISEAYKTLPRDGGGLREIFAEVSSENVGDLIKNPDFLGVLNEIKEFAVDLSHALASKKPLNSQEHRCNACRSQWKVELYSGRRALSCCPFCRAKYSWDRE